MPLTTAQVWTVLDRYYDLRKSWPIGSTLAQVSGASHVERKDAPPALCFVCDVRGALETLTASERDAVEVVYHTRRAMNDADACAKMADHDARRTTLRDVQDLRMRSRREWRSIGNSYRQELHRAMRRKDYRRGIDRLSVELELMVLVKQLARVLEAV